MDPSDPTGILYTKIRSLDPENASKIVGYLLIQDIGKRDLMRLALGPETLLQSLILKAKADLGLSPNSLSSPSTPSSPSPLKPISRPININPLSQSSQRTSANGYLDFARNPPSPSLNSSLSKPKARPFPPFDDIRTGSLLGSSVSNPNNGGLAPDSGGDVTGTGDLVDELQFNDYLSFLNDPSSKNDDFVDQSGPFGYSVSNGDAHLHRRSFSASDVCFGSEDEGFGSGFKPCMYFSRGFCKNGDSCKFIHGGFGDNFDMGGGVVGSPSKIDYVYHQHEEMMRMKAAHQQRLAAAQFMAGVPQMPFEKSMNFLLHSPNDPQRVPPLLLGEEGFRYGSPSRLERHDFLGMGFADKSNSASRQIYLTFPADSTFKDEDVSNYFSIFGLVQDVRIPYQQKRMFGFVTFVHPETVKLILARGNPHFICDSRVLVKPYKEKGKILEKRHQQIHHQQIERGNFSPSSAPSGIDHRDLYDFHHGPKMLYDTQEMIMRRKLEQADLHQAIELQRRRFMNLELPDLKNECVHSHQRSLSIGSPVYFSSRANQNTFISLENASQEIGEANRNNPAVIMHQTGIAIGQAPEQETSLACINSKEYGNSKEGRQEVSFEHTLPDSLFASPTKSNNNSESDSTQGNDTGSLSATNETNPALSDPTAR